MTTATHCPSCNRAWTDHLGIAGTCKRLSEANDIIADAFAQMSIHEAYRNGIQWHSAGGLSTCEMMADYLVSIGRLVKHPTRYWYRWKK